MRDMDEVCAMLHLIWQACTVALATSEYKHQLVSVEKDKLPDKHYLY